MDEKIIIQSQHYTGKKAKKILLLIGTLITLFFLVAAIIALVDSSIYHYEWLEETYAEHNTAENGYCYKRCEACKEFESYSSASDYYTSDFVANIGLYLLYCVACCIPLALFAFIAWIIKRYLNSFEMTVTDKRIYGKIKWGKRVDLPIDSVSAVGIGAFKSIAISTASGRISFSAIKNRNEIHDVVSKLLVDRQKQTTTPAPSTAPASSVSNADELKKYKELLDSGIITQEEFDAKKKQLLGL